MKQAMVFGISGDAEMERQLLEQMTFPSRQRYGLLQGHFHGGSV